MASSKPRKRRPKMVIRSYEPADIEAISILMREPSVVAGTLQMPHRSTEWRKEQWNKMDETRHTLVAEVGGEIVGMASIQIRNRPRVRHTGALGMAVAERVRRRGVGTALLREILDMGFGWLGLMRIELSVWVDNEGAVLLYRKHGFLVEGIVRAHGLRDGKLVDSFQMARLADRLPWDRVTAEEVAQRLPPMLPSGSEPKKAAKKERTKKKKKGGWDIN
ncbi:MAG: GNAT family N-acetyltransferase [Myxococcota bacterium]